MDWQTSSTKALENALTSAILALVVSLFEFTVSHPLFLPFTLSRANGSFHVTEN